MIAIISTSLEHVETIHAIEMESFADPWSINAIAYEISQKHSICLIAINEAKTVVGHISMRHIINEGHISNIAVLKAYRKQGIGALLLEALIKKAIEYKMIGLTLEVRVSNQAALSLYEKYGFRIEGYRKNYYASPSEDAAIMWKKLSEDNMTSSQS